jgi:hypothetical protein
MGGEEVSTSSFDPLLFVVVDVCCGQCVIVSRAAYSATRIAVRLMGRAQSAMTSEIELSGSGTELSVAGTLRCTGSCALDPQLIMVL